MPFKPNRVFRRRYNRVFKKDPLAANMFLLICEIADKNGQVKINPEELAELFAARFNDPKEYAL